MIALEARDLAVEAGGAVILEGLTLTLRAGDKVGVVGRNGAGKTSLLRVLAGEAPPVRGTVGRRGAAGYLAQDSRRHLAEEDSTAFEHILSARGLVEMSRLLERSRTALEKSHAEATVSRYTRIEEEYRRLDGYRAESAAHTVAAGLGIARDRLAMPIRALSGGERRRVELARILFGGSELLLLDEPTNHLDVDAKAWLMRFLASHRGAVLLVSHDIALLDASITRILHVEDGRAVEFRGTYSRFREALGRERERLGALADRQDKEIKRLKTLADAMRGQTTKRARIAKTIDTRVEKLRARRVERPPRERRVRFRFPPPPHCGRLVLEARGLSKSYGGPRVFDEVGFDLGRGERLLVLGLNGAGKSSLLRILAGVSQPDSGSVRAGQGVRLGYYAQEHEGIREGLSVLDHMRRESPADDQALRGLLGMFGLSADVAFQDAGTLSGGEKTKLALAQLVAGRNNVLLLDEPTNNLDPPSTAAAAEALAGWPGTMVIVSHDTPFVEELAPQRVLTMPDGGMDFWSEDLLELVALA